MITIRKTEPTDLLMVSDWISGDMDHNGMEASFFTAEGEGISCYTIEDEEGPAIFVRQEAVGEDTRLHTQFPANPKRVANALEQAYPLVAANARELGFKNVRFETGSIALVRFMFHHFQFRAELIGRL